MYKHTPKKRTQKFYIKASKIKRDYIKAHLVFAIIRLVLKAFSALDTKFVCQRSYFGESTQGKKWELCIEFYPIQFVHLLQKIKEVKIIFKNHA